MILYGALTRTSVGKLFIAGIVPGLVMASLLAITVVVMAIRNPELAPPQPPTSWRERLSSLRMAWIPVALIVVMLGSIYSGVATPTEAAAIGAIGGFVIAGVVYRRLTRQVFVTSVMGTLRTSSFVLLVMMGANILAYAISQALQHDLLPSDLAFDSVGSWWVAREDIQDEIDVVAIAGDQTVLVGECKWSIQAVDMRVLDGLQAALWKATPDLNPIARPWRAIFSRSGFSEDLTALATRPEERVLLIRPDDLY